MRALHKEKTNGIKKRIDSLVCSWKHSSKDWVDIFQKWSWWLEWNSGDSPGGPMIKASPCSAGDSRFDPGWGHRGPACHWTTEFLGHNWRACVLQQKIPCDATKTQCSQINNYF